MGTIMTWAVHPGEQPKGTDSNRVKTLYIPAQAKGGAGAEAPSRKEPSSCSRPLTNEPETDRRDSK